MVSKGCEWSCWTLTLIDVQALWLQQRFSWPLLCPPESRVPLLKNFGNCLTRCLQSNPFSVQSGSRNPASVEGTSEFSMGWLLASSLDNMSWVLLLSANYLSRISCISSRQIVVRVIQAAMTENSRCNDPNGVWVATSWALIEAISRLHQQKVLIMES